MPVKKLKDFLDSHKVKYVTIKHSTAYTTQEIAASAHIPGKEMAKTVIIKVDGKMAMAVLPASNKIDFALLKKNIRVKDIQLANEQEFEYTFPQCDVGSMPPFGNLYDMDVFVAESLTEDEEITFNAGSYSELMKVAYKDFERLVNPKIVKFSLQ